MNNYNNNPSNNTFDDLTNKKVSLNQDENENKFKFGAFSRSEYGGNIISYLPNSLISKGFRCYLAK